MGLDITAGSKYSKVTDKQKIEDHDYQVNIQRNNHLEIDRALDVEVGSYDLEGETITFCAGSYSGYNRFRKTLCYAILGVEDKKLWERSEYYMDKPFYEIINFSDCEGSFGPKDSVKLYNDFVTNKHKFLNYLHSGGSDYLEIEHLKTIYDDFTKGFKLASDNGLLIFN